MIGSNTITGIAIGLIFTVIFGLFFLYYVQCPKSPRNKKQLWGGHLWNPSCFVATVSDRSLEQVKNYIDDQKIK